MPSISGAPLRSRSPEIRPGSPAARAARIRAMPSIAAMKTIGITVAL